MAKNIKKQIDFEIQICKMLRKVFLLVVYFAHTAFSCVGRVIVSLNIKLCLTEEF